MLLIIIFLSIIITSVLAVIFVNTKTKGIITVLTVIALSIISSIPAINSLLGNNFEILLSGTLQLGLLPIKIDELSAWFILTINFTITTGAIYGVNYMKQYIEQKNNLTLHCIAYILVHSTLISICSVQNGMFFILLWEIMALSAFLLVIFENYKPETLKAGINYLIQSHISIIFLIIGFIYVSINTNNFSFESFAVFTSQQPVIAGVVLFMCFFIGFGIKAGFVPFHTWLPYAHPAAPAHISGVMSGVIIKIGIYGILRMLLLIKTDYLTIGFIILVISLISGIYGVMLAIVQHNLKRLLAYHSIENIGIIGIGIGLGCIGLGSENKILTILGFSGALLHTLNHSLFKSLLFFAAGNVYQIVHNPNIEKLGGLINKMPKTSLLFLLAAIAICGLPPLNGFISEFLIYSGIYYWLGDASLVSLFTIAFSILGLVLIGGLAILCFTKAFGIVFLGSSRNSEKKIITEVSFWQLLPMYLIAIFMILIGVFPAFFIKLVQKPVQLFSNINISNSANLSIITDSGLINSLQSISFYSIIFILLILLILGLRKLANKNKIISSEPTWGCGYKTENPKLQYTASSFVRTFSKLAKPVLEIEKKEIEFSEVFPNKLEYETHPYDKVEKIFIDKFLSSIKKISEWFTFLQNGKLQRYILYGIIFITSVIIIPYFIEKISKFFDFFMNL